MIFRIVFIFTVIFFAAYSSCSYAAGGRYDTQLEAYTACMNDADPATFVDPQSGYTWNYVCERQGNKYRSFYLTDDPNNGGRRCHRLAGSCSIDYYFDHPYENDCLPGISSHHDRWVPVADGKHVVACSGECAVAWQVTWHGSVMSKDEVNTGALCPASEGNPDDVDPPTPTETTNPDGSTTWCDGDGVCVTGPAPSTSAPAPASSAPNNSTETHTTTDHPASSSSTTTTETSTTTGSGGSGGGGGTTVTDTTGHSVTDTPAHSSSSSSKCEGGVCDVGDADGQLGHMYSSSGSSVSTVYGNFRRDVMSTPIMSSVDSFFDVSNVGGECPTWHIPGNKYWGNAGFDFDFFCSPAMLSIFSMAGFIVLAVGAFSAFRIAVY